MDGDNSFRLGYCDLKFGSPRKGWRFPNISYDE
jgi:hypothetical protein